MRILILGGYGTFGGRLAQLLKDEAALTLLIAGRSLPSAQAFCDRLGGAARLVPLQFDRDGDLRQQLHAAQPELLVDASGPFQDYSGDPYRVVAACIEARVDYMDLADGSAFVKGIARFDAAAQQRGIAVLSGVSSFPVLTAAVVRRLYADLARIERISAGIAPSPYAAVGPNVIRAIAGYSGKKTRLVRGGQPAWGHALTETRRYTIAPPGQLPLRSIRFSLVDVPDLQLLPELWAGIDSVWIGAGPVPELLHRMLNGLAWLVRLRLLPTLLPLAPLFHWVIGRCRWGEPRGGMFVAVQGRDALGQPQQRSWHLLAEGDDGPLIPSMAVEALVRRRLKGFRPAAGARAALHELELEDYEALFRQRRIHSGQRRPQPPQAPLYRRLLGEAWDELPPALRALHDCGAGAQAQGRATVERGGGWISRLVGACFGFPAAGADIPVAVRFEPRRGGEWWRRSFGGRTFRSFHREGRGRSERLLSERFGPFSFGIALVLDQGRLHFVVRRWNLLGLPLPPSWAPGGDSWESAEDGRFNFRVEIRQRWIGLLVAYRGWLEPDTRSQSSHSRPS
jgi:hypothetical protein